MRILSDNFNADLCNCTTFVSLLSKQEHFSVHYVLGALIQLQRTIISIFISVCLSIRPSVHLSSQNSPSLGCVFTKFDILTFSKNLSRKLKFGSNRTRITGSLQEVFCKFVIISHRILPRTRNVSDKRCRELQTQTVCSIT
jgi:hypothetical protein